MFLSISSSILVSAVTNVGSLDVCMTKIGYVAALVSIVSVSFFSSLVFFNFQSAINYDTLMNKFLLGVLVGAGITIACKIFGGDHEYYNSTYGQPLLAAWDCD